MNNYKRKKIKLSNTKVSKLHYSVMKNIHYGCIDYYYSLYFSSNIDSEQLYINLKKYISNTIQQHKKDCVYSILDNIDEYREKFGAEALDGLKISSNFKEKKNDKKKAIIKNFEQLDITNIEIDKTPNGFQIIPISGCNSEYENITSELENEYLRYKKIYGDAFVNNCQKLYLPPLKIRQHHEQYCYIHAALYIYKNNLMSLRISLPIKNCNSKYLMQYEHEKYIGEIIDCYNIGFDYSDINIDSIKGTYINYILKSNKKIKEIIVPDHHITNMILTDFDGMPIDIDNMSDSLKQDIYKIIIAPMGYARPTSLLKHSSEYIKRNSKTYDGVAYITNYHSKCLSLVDSTFISDVTKKIKCEIDDSINSQIVDNLRFNVEYTFLILSLKLSNIGYLSYQKSHMTDDQNNINASFNKNNIFIIDLQQNCYGSVKDQLIFMESKMLHPLDKKNIQIKSKAIDKITNDKANRINLKFQNFVSISGIVLTSVFGLPAIYETINLIRETCTFINNNIPLITKENISITIWILIVFILIIMTYQKNRK